MTEDHLGPLLGRGRTADVFDWGPGRVLKLFHTGFRAEAVQAEMQVSVTLGELSVPAPGYHGCVRLGERTGLIFERIDGPSMLAVFKQQPWRVVSLARELADLHLAIHRHRASGLPSQRARLERLIGLAPDFPDTQRATVLARLATLPDGEYLCHGDFHPDNVLLSAGGPVVLDWLTATQGVPAADVARTLLLLQQATPPPDAGSFFIAVLQLVRRLFAAAYWQQYARQSALPAADLRPWRLPLLAARLGEAVPAGERRKILRLLQRELSDSGAAS